MCTPTFVCRFVQKKIMEKQQNAGEFTDEDGAFPHVMTDVFCDTSLLQNTPYMARGIYEDDDDHDQNHTFCAIAHEHGSNFFFSIVECVTPVLVLQERTIADCQHRQTEFMNSYGSKNQLHVLNKKIMSKRYKHILWIGPYMVFECVAACATKHAYISFGAGSYQMYTGEQCVFLPFKFCVHFLSTGSVCVSTSLQ